MPAGTSCCKTRSAKPSHEGQLISLDIPAPTKTTSSPDWAAFSISGGTSGKGLKVADIQISFTCKRPLRKSCQGRFFVAYTFSEIFNSAATMNITAAVNAVHRYRKSSSISLAKKRSMTFLGYQILCVL